LRADGCGSRGKCRRIAGVDNNMGAISFRALAMANPSPRDAPVTRATRFSSENIFVMASSNKKAGKLPAFSKTC